MSLVKKIMFAHIGSSYFTIKDYGELAVAATLDGRISEDEVRILSICLNCKANC
jgi:hypothetical protein